MKKLTSLLLSVMMIVCLPMSVRAEKGPSDLKWGDNYYMAYISLFNPSGDDDSYRVFSQNKADDLAINGAVYDRNSNTLTVTNFKHPELILETNMMGDDFSLKVEGECELGRISVWGDGWGGSINITGTGSLKVNADKKYESAIRLMAEGSNAKINIEKTVTVNLYASQFVIEVSDTLYSDKNSAITIDNKSVSETKGGLVEYDDIESVSAIDADNDISESYILGYKITRASDPDGVYTYNVYKENGENYYSICKWIKVDKVNALVRDSSFGDYGELNMKESDFVKQSDYTVIKESQPQKVYYLIAGEGFGYSSPKAVRASDPDGIYCAGRVWNGGDISKEPDGYYIHRLIYDNDLMTYRTDTGFQVIEYTADEFKNSEYSLVYEDEYDYEYIRYVDEDYDIEDFAQEGIQVTNSNDPETMYVALEYPYGGEVEGYNIEKLEYNSKVGCYYDMIEDDEITMTLSEFEKSTFSIVMGNSPVQYIDNRVDNISNMNVYADSNGKKYVVRYGDVYDYSEQDTVTILGTKVYIVKANSSVDADKLTPVATHIVTDLYGYYVDKKGLSSSAFVTDVDKQSSDPVEQPQKQPTDTTVTPNPGSESKVPASQGTEISNKDSKDTSDYVVINSDKSSPAVSYNGDDSKTKTGIVIPATVTDANGVTYAVTKISDNALKGNKTIKSVTVGDNVEEIGTGAFQNAAKLTTVKLGKNVAKIDKKAFAGCTSLKKVTASGSKVKTVADEAFKGDKKLTEIDLSKSSVSTIGKNAFNGDNSLKKVKLNGNSLKKVGKGAFKGIKKNATITIKAKDKKTYKKAVNLIKKSGVKNVKFKHTKK